MSRRPARGSNPFEDDVVTGTNPFDDEPAPTARVVPLLSKPPLDPYEGKPSKNGTTNPFDFDSDFKTVTKEDTPILFGMDTDEQFDVTPAATTPAAKQSKRGSTAINVESLTGWLRGTKVEEHVHVPLQDEEDSPKKMKQVAEWPYDYYHINQQKYYDTVDSSQVKEETETASYVVRPPDLPDIPTAVQGLSLVDFENTAEQRAIGIVSTWIYDEGLMDELIVTGGLKNMSLDGEAKMSEGVEISSRGYAIEGTQKIDKEIEKLRSSTARELALINARLNDGVAASGSEVQDLVNAVTATKGDLGKLRELSTYITQGGIDTSSALLANYPRLKLAINARRNLARCFRELDFFTQIPATCERLRDEMHSSEWTDEEWTTLRNVCREHVELEVFLIEAEAGMKARIDEEQMLQSARSDRRNNVQTSNSFLNTAGGTSYSSVDKFLQEHVKIVWELGDELRLRVLSGVGMTFDLALNNPAGMVALVEAVELYESAGEEYKAVYGDKLYSDRLHFTDMRKGALDHIAKDFEVRGLEVFQEVQQMVSQKASRVVPICFKGFADKLCNAGGRHCGRRYGDCKLQCRSPSIEQPYESDGLCDSSNGTMLS